MKTKLLFSTVLIFSQLIVSQTSVPDDAFENYLETHNASGIIVPLGDPTSMGDGIAGNDLVTTANISSVTTLNVINLGINQLTGISDFSSLLVLNCQNNNLANLDVSSNTNLQTLVCQDNQITSLNIGSPPNLSQIFCSDNQLTSIAITTLVNLTWLEIENNPGLTSLDLSGNPVIQRLHASNSPIGNVDYTGKTFLSYLYLNNCGVTSLDVAPISFLRELEVSDNSLSSLNLTSNIFDFRRLICDNNNLTTLNVKNGINNMISGANFSALSNNLTCITVDDVTYSTTNWTSIDGGVVFSLDCTALGVEDENLASFEVFPNPTKGNITISLNSSASYSLVSMLGQEIEKGTFTYGDNALDISQLSKGLYLLNIKTNQGTATKKIIKE
jgi:hypothetical protein